MLATAWDYFARVKLPFFIDGQTTGLEPQFPMPKQVSSHFLQTFHLFSVNLGAVHWLHLRIKQQSGNSFNRDILECPSSPAPYRNMSICRLDLEHNGDPRSQGYHG